MVIVAVVIATPIAWFVMDKWLQDFTDRIHISWTIFAFTTVIVLAIAFATMSFQVIRAALTSPVKNLKSE
jgi:putative ABC transport system permease protein